MRLFVGQSSSILREQGVVIVKNPFPDRLLRSLRSESSRIERKVCSRLDELGEEYRSRATASEVGVGVGFAGPRTFRYHEAASRCFGRLDVRHGTGRPPFSEVSEDPYLRGIVRGILGGDAVHVYTGLIMSFSGSATQPWHQDGPCLFPELGDHTVLPPYALTLFIPVSAVTEELGPTEFLVGSHRNGDAKPDGKIDERKWIGPLLEPGDVLIYEYRVVHRGTSNLSTPPPPSDSDDGSKKMEGSEDSKESTPASTRSMVYLLFARPWFKEHLNFGTERLFPAIPVERAAGQLGKKRRGEI